MLFVLRILWKSALFCAVLFGLLVWGFGLPATWPWYVTIAAVVVGVIVVGAIAIYAFFFAVIKDAFNDDEPPRFSCLARPPSPAASGINSPWPGAVRRVGWASGLC